jgi:hypothetical protein
MLLNYGMKDVTAHLRPMTNWINEILNHHGMSLAKESMNPPYSNLIIEFISAVNFALIIITCSDNNSSLP